VPDIYQGTEYWDLSLVDPDNRFPVDFAARQNSLGAAISPGLISNWSDGRIKQLVTRRVLAVRKNLPTLFSDGAYLPLEITGLLADHVIAFARTLHNSSAITVISRLTAHILAGDGALTIPVSRWKDTRLIVPAQLGDTFADNLLPQDKLSITPDIGVGQILGRLPVALLTNHL
jgi:(1->4)-alpha-D-glucan 1-alpha-D-glucosylmutase